MSNVIERNHSVNMIRENLEGLPAHPLPPGYHIRWYEPGDEQHWFDIHLQADRFTTFSPDRFVREFGTDATVLAQRQAYLLDAQHRAIGTASAWWDDDYFGRPYGRIHWVAVVPGAQGRGLGKALLSAVCARMRALGHTRAYLVTSTARVPAIRMYKSFGFVPHIRNADDRLVWNEFARLVPGFTWDGHKE